MSKATVNMTNWELYVYKDRYMLSGTADNHPDLGKNSYVSSTSMLVDYKFSDDVLIYETGNTIYRCPLKYMIIWPYIDVTVEYREILTHRLEMSESILDKIIAATAKLSIMETRKRYENSGESVFGIYDAVCQITEDYSDDEFLNHIIEIQRQGQIEIEEMRVRENNRLINIACNYEDCAYIEVSSVGCGNLLAYHIGNYSGVIQPILHGGMRQDSILYIKYPSKNDPCFLDFRYFPKSGQDMKTYIWSNNIKRAVIKNDTRYLLRFNEVDIPIGETMFFARNEEV